MFILTSFYKPFYLINHKRRFNEGKCKKKKLLKMYHSTLDKWNSQVVSYSNLSLTLTCRAVFFFLGCWRLQMIIKMERTGSCWFYNCLFWSYWSESVLTVLKYNLRKKKETTQSSSSVNTNDISIFKCKDCDINIRY